MMGLMFFGALFLYVLLCLLLAWLASWVAARCGVAGWKAGLPVFIGLLLLVFWDWLPMEVTFRYDCAKYAGFTQYQTLEAWKRENPGVAETLVPIKNPRSERHGDVERYVLNQRFAWEIRHTPHWFHIQERDERIVDMKTAKVLARYVDFSTDILGLELGYSARGISDYKIWMKKQSCEVGQRMPEKIKFNGYKGKIEDIGRG